MDEIKQAIRDHLVKLLGERGVNGSSEVVAGLADDCLVGAADAIRRWDDEASGRPGLLVHMLRSNDLGAYRHPSERTRVDGAPTASSDITPALIKSVKAGCSTPNGITREEARGLYMEAASRRGVRVDVLIDAAMGRDWQVTPPHPAFDPENPDKARDYERLVAGA